MDGSRRRRGCPDEALPEAPDEKLSHFAVEFAKGSPSWYSLLLLAETSRLRQALFSAL